MTARRATSTGTAGWSVSARQPRAVERECQRLRLTRACPDDDELLRVFLPEVCPVRLDDVKQFYAANYTPTGAELVIVGDINEKEVIGKLGFLKNWKKKAVTVPADVKAPAIASTKIYLVDKPDAAQSECLQAAL